jgi:CRP/FNR family transcriptional regulator, anaerobic regulatory protein
MTASHARPVPGGGGEPCASCDARPHSVCGAVALEDLPRLAALATVRVLDPGQGFVAEGDPAEHFFSITAGTAKLFKLLPDGRRQITGFAVEGRFLGIAADGVYVCGAEAVDRLHLCQFSRPKLRRLMAAFSALEERLLDAAWSELAAAQEQMLLLGRKTARERLASFLVALGQPHACAARPPQPDGALRVALPMSRQDIADYLGLTIETVSRTLTRLRQEGLIAVPDASAVLLREPARLQRIADGLP